MDTQKEAHISNTTAMDLGTKEGNSPETHTQDKKDKKKDKKDTSRTQGQPKLDIPANKEMDSKEFASRTGLLCRLYTDLDTKECTSAEARSKESATHTQKGQKYEEEK